MSESILGRLGEPERRPTKLKALFYGAPGTGKTRLLGTAPKLLMLDADGGATTVRDNPNVTVWRLKTWKDFDDAIGTLMFEKHGFESVGLDTVTTTQMIAETEVDLLSYIMNPKGEPRQGYQKTAAMLRHKLVLMTQLDMHVLFAAHLRINDGGDIEEGTYTLTPDVQPAVQRVVFALPDVIGRTFIKDMGGGEYKHALAFGPDGRTLAKERNFGLPKEAVGLTIPHLIKQVTGTMSKEKANA